MRTGRFRFRETWFGRQILEVELSSPGDRFCSYRVRSWMRGTASDAANIMQRLNGTVEPPTTGSAIRSKAPS